MSEPQVMVRLCVNLPKALIDSLESQATEQRLPVSWVACDAIAKGMGVPPPPRPIWGCKARKPRATGMPPGGRSGEPAGAQGAEHGAQREPVEAPCA